MFQKEIHISFSNIHDYENQYNRVTWLLLPETVDLSER